MFGNLVEYGTQAPINFWVEFGMNWVLFVVVCLCASVVSSFFKHYTFNVLNNQKLEFHANDAFFKVVLFLMWMMISTLDFWMMLFPAITDYKIFILRIFLVARVATLYYHIEWLAVYGLSGRQIAWVLAEDVLLLFHSIIFLKVSNDFPQSDYMFMSLLYSMVMALSQMLSFLALGGHVVYVKRWMSLLRWMPLNILMNLILELTSVTWTTTSTAQLIMAFILSCLLIINGIIDVVTGRKCLLRGITAGIHIMGI